MNIRRIKPSGTVLIVAAALVVGLEAPAMAHQVKAVAHKISGASIAAHSIPGNRLKNNTLTGSQIKESTLGTVPRATRASKLPPLVWHPLTLQNNWVTYNSNFRTPSYAIDAQGFVHLAGAIKNGTANKDAFVLPAVARPLFTEQLATDGNAGVSIRLKIDPNGQVTPEDDLTKGTPAELFTSLDGVAFPTS
jgi:hypothetical protein